VNPSTLAKRSHPSSLVVTTSTEDTIESSIARGIALPRRGSAMPATKAPPVRRAAGVKAEARRGRALCGALHAGEHRASLSAASLAPNCLKRCIQIEQEPILQGFGS
jgi:hypothetical protein